MVTELALNLLFIRSSFLGAIAPPIPSLREADDRVACRGVCYGSSASVPEDRTKDVLLNAAAHHRANFKILAQAWAAKVPMLRGFQKICISCCLRAGCMRGTGLQYRWLNLITCFKE